MVQRDRSMLGEISRFVAKTERIKRWSQMFRWLRTIDLIPRFFRCVVIIWCAWNICQCLRLEYQCFFFIPHLFFSWKTTYKFYGIDFRNIIDKFECRGSTWERIHKRTQCICYPCFTFVKGSPWVVVLL